MPQLLKVASVKDIPPGSHKVVQAEKEPISIINVKGRLFAVRNVCLHKGGPVGEGLVNDDELTIKCPWHGWTYHLETGKNVADPTKILPTYKVKVKGSDVFLEL